MKGGESRKMLRRNVVKKTFSKIEAIVENDILFGGMKEEEVGIAAYKTCTDTEVLISFCHLSDIAGRSVHSLGQECKPEA